jgi:hypothetical protein|tara:strand:+ start:46 stop:237 length:192 start_codon:yes stop_codon:yes gene_type:complete
MEKINIMDNEYKDILLDGYNKISSEKLRKMYWVIKKTNPIYLNDIDTLKMEVFREILTNRLEW